MYKDGETQECLTRKFIYWGRNGRVPEKPQKASKDTPDGMHHDITTPKTRAQLVDFRSSIPSKHGAVSGHYGTEGAESCCHLIGAASFVLWEQREWPSFLTESPFNWFQGTWGSEKEKRATSCRETALRPADRFNGRVSETSQQYHVHEPDNTNLCATV